MTVSGLNTKFYNVDPDNNNWISVKEDALVYKDQAREVDLQLRSDARVEIAKSFAKGGLGIGTTIGLAGLSFLAYKIATLAVGIIVFPLMIIPPLYGLVTLLAGAGVGGAIFYMTTQKFCSKLFKEAQQHWNHGQHLYSQAFVARLKMPALQEAK